MLPIEQGDFLFPFFSCIISTLSQYTSCTLVFHSHLQHYFTLKSICLPFKVLAFSCLLKVSSLWDWMKLTLLLAEGGSSCPIEGQVVNILGFVVWGDTYGFCHSHAPILGSKQPQAPWKGVGVAMCLVKQALGPPPARSALAGRRGAGFPVLIYQSCFLALFYNLAVWRTTFPATKTLVHTFLLLNF